MAIVTGTNFDDFISVGGPPVNGENTTNGNDVVSGLKGSDIILGGAGRDLLGGDAGNDIIYGDSSNAPGDLGNGQPGGNNTEDDTIFGGKGRDTLFGEDDDDSLFGGADNDLLYGGVNDDLVRGGADNDRAFGDSGDDDVRGDAGNDSVYGGSGDDSVNGGDGNDRVEGNAGWDVVNGGLGNDILRGDNQSLVPVVNIGFDIFEWTETAAGVTERDRVEDFNALPTILDGILGIDHIDLSAILTIEQVDAGDLKIVENVGGNLGRTQLFVDTNGSNAFDLVIDVFSNKGVDWNVGFVGNPDAEIWVG